MVKTMFGTWMKVLTIGLVFLFLGLIGPEYAMAAGKHIIPEAGSEIASHWDRFYGFVYGVSVFFFILVMAMMGFFVLRYSKSKNPTPTSIHGHNTLEIFWTLIPTALLMVIFFWGFSVYKRMVEAPMNSYEVKVIGKQWLWQFQYDDGRVTTNELYVPARQPIKLLLSSDDVLHSFFIPSFRVKHEVVPGIYTSVWFEATGPGTHQIYCTEYCGTAHSSMLAKVHVLEPADWEKWKRGKKIQIPGVSPDGEAAAGTGPGSGAESATAPGAASGMSGLAAQGKTITEQKGCIACHTADGSQRIGPSYKGIWGKKEEFEGGVTAVVDENYLRESIENPQAKIVKGFKTTAMPPYKGLLSETEMNAVIEYIKSLK